MHPFLCTGTATNAIKISQMLSESKIIGIDISRDMLRDAKDKIQKKFVINIKLYFMDATCTKFKNKCFVRLLYETINIWCRSNRYFICPFVI